MFTRATKEFGIWRKGSGKRGARAGTPTYSLILALGVCAFVSWFIFFIVFKIRGEFYFFETSQLDIPVASHEIDQSVYFSYRSPAAAVGIIEDDEGRISLVFDDGRVFRYPSQKNDLKLYVRERSKKLELMTMITKVPSRTIGRIQFWVEREVAFQVFHEILGLFTQFGFDDFDLALTKPALLANELDTKPHGAKSASSLKRAQGEL